jgi:hypothetical protein
MQQPRAFKGQPIPNFCHVHQLDPVIVTLSVARKDPALISVLNVLVGFFQSIGPPVAFPLAIRVSSPKAPSSNKNWKWTWGIV